jgi:hypothetical protein
MHVHQGVYTYTYYFLRLLLSGWLLTNVQVNIITMLHDTRHTCIYITLVLLFISSFYTSSIFLGRLAALHSLRPLQYVYIIYIYIHTYIHKHVNTYILQTERKFVFLGWQTTNSNRRLLFQQTCPTTVCMYIPHSCVIGRF